MVLPKIGSFRTRNQPKNERTQTKTVSEIRTEYSNALNSGSYHQKSQRNAQQPAAQCTNTLKNGRPTAPTATRMKQNERKHDSSSSTINNSNTNRTQTTRSNNNSNSNRTIATRSSMTLKVQNSATSRNNIGSPKVQLDGKKPEPQFPNLNLSGDANRKNQQCNFPNKVQQQNPKMIRKVILFLKMKAMDVERVDAAIQQQYQQQQQQNGQQQLPLVNIHDITETTQEDSFSTISNHSASRHVVSTLKQQQTSSPKTDKATTTKQHSSKQNRAKKSATNQLPSPSPNREKERRLKSTNDLLLGSKSSSSRDISKDTLTKEIELSKKIVGLRRTIIEEELKQFLETHNTDVDDNDPNNTDDVDDQFITTDDTDEDNRNKNYDGDFYDSNHNHTQTTTENEVDHDDEDLDSDELHDGSLNTLNNDTVESEYDRVVDGIDTTTTDDLADFDSSDFLDDYQDDGDEEDDDDNDSNNTTDATDFYDDDDSDDDEYDEDEFNRKVYDPLAPLNDFSDLFPDYIPWGRGPGSIASSSKPGKTKSTSTKTTSNRKHTKRSSVSSTCSISVRTSNSNVTVASYVKEKNNPFSRHYVHPSEQSPSVRRKNLATRAAMMATIQQQQKQKQKQKKLNKKKLAKCNTVANSSTSSTNKKMKDRVTGYRSSKAKNKMFIPPRKIEVERFIIQAPAASISEPTATITNTTVTSTTATTVTVSNHSTRTNNDTVPLGIPQLPLSDPLPKPRSNVNALLDRQIPPSPLRRHPYDRDPQNHRYELDRHPRYQEPHPESGASAYPKHDTYYPGGRKTPSYHHHGRSTPSSHADSPSNDQHPPHDHLYHYHDNEPKHNDLRYGRRRSEYDQDDYYQRRQEPNQYDEPHHHPHPSFGYQPQKNGDDFHRPTTPTNLRPTTPVNGSARATPTTFNLTPTPFDQFHSSRTPAPYGPSTRDDHYSHSAASVSGANYSYSSRHSHDHYSQPRDPTFDESYRQSRSCYSTTNNDSQRHSRSDFHHPDDGRYPPPQSSDRGLHNRMSDYDSELHSDQHGYEHQRGGNYQHNSQSNVSDSLVVYNGSPETNFDHRYNQYRRDINDYEDWNPNRGPPSMTGPPSNIVSPSSPNSRNHSSYERTHSAIYSRGREHFGTNMDGTQSYQHSNHHYAENHRKSREPRGFYDDGNQRIARNTNSHQIVREQNYNERNKQRLGFVGTIPEGQPYNNHFHQSNRSLDTGLRQNTHSEYNHDFARTTHDGRSVNNPHHRRDNFSEDFQSGLRNDDGIHSAQRREHRPPYPSLSQPNGHHDYRQKYLSSYRSSIEKDSMYSGRNESSTAIERDRYSGNFNESFDPLSLEKPYSRVVSPIHFSSFQGRETPTDRRTMEKPGSRWDELDAKYQNKMDLKNNKVPTSPRHKGYPYDGDGVSSKTNTHHSNLCGADNASVTNSKKFTFSYPLALQPLNDPCEVKNQQDLGSHSTTAYQQQTHVHSHINADALCYSMSANERRLNFNSNRLLSDNNTKIARGPSPCLPESDCVADDVTVNTQNTSNFDSFAQDLGPDSTESQPGYSRRLYFPSQTSFKSDQSSITMSGHHRQTRGTNPSPIPPNNDPTQRKEALASRNKGSEQHPTTAKRLTDPPRAYDIVLDPDTLLQHSDNSRNSSNLSTMRTEFRQQQSVTHNNVASAYRNSLLDKYPVNSANAQRQPHQNNHSNSRGADGSDQQQPSPQHIEICKGVYGILRDANETIQAYENGFIVYPVCLVCSLDLVSIADAEYVLCPSCKVVSPVVVDESSRKGLPIVARRPGGGVCLGLDASRCR